ncbi:Similar to Protein transport protein SFT2; acc. no. P38166 [Pyronema omphalodes CBS 100304]|uniref:Protein transport protein SFT2 n=1 Tax=Pyronema omphalodes (strain CBS 100304) TaxID=1076935 RepID=U4LL39_PYROM|nr:Similar to Protein transport protein SFT2; acc. no. P38166 [Pyronema omphalodes CBS 100304]
MAADSFRAQMNSLGWSRREEPAISTAPQGFASRLASLNPFAEGGYVRLPTTNAAPLPAQTRQQEEEGYFALSRWDRMLAFTICNLGAAACFVICFFLFPVLSLRPRKFAVLSNKHIYKDRFANLIFVCISWTVGSLLFLSSWAILQGPMNYTKHLLSTPRLPFTAAYFGSIVVTLVCSLKAMRLRRFEARAKGMSSQGYGAMSRWPVDGICDGGWEHVTIYGNTADEYLNHTGLSRYFTVL